MNGVLAVFLRREEMCVCVCLYVFCFPFYLFLAPDENLYLDLKKEFSANLCLLLYQV